MLFLHRRTVLKTVGASVVAAGLPGWAGAQVSGATVTVVLIARKDTVAPETLAQVRSLFAEAFIPVGVALDPEKGPVPASEPGGPVDVLVWAKKTVELVPYFQMRKLTEAHAALALRLPTDARLFGLCAKDPGGALDLRGLRAPGLRNAVLVPEKSGPAWIESHPAQVACSRGGHPVEIGEPQAALSYLQKAIDDPDQTHAALFLDLDGPAEEVLMLAETIAGALTGHIDAGQLAPLGPEELGARRTGDFQRLIGLRLDPPPAAAMTELDRAALTALSTALTEAGIGHSIAFDDPSALGASDCLRLDPAAIGPDDIAGQRGLACALVAPPDPALAPALAEAGTHAAMGAAPEGLVGIDGEGLHHLGNARKASGWKDIEAIVAGLSLPEEPVIALDTAALALPAQRNAAVAVLRNLNEVPGTHVIDLDTYSKVLISADPVFETMRDTRTHAPENAAVPRNPDAGERAALMDDARRAWAFFEVMTNQTTGLPDATVHFAADGSPGSRHEVLTQWDTGSVIFGLIGARKLGLIADEAFTDRRDRILASLKAATLARPRLPRAEFYVANPWRGSSDVNVCDLARLLSALAALDRMAAEDDTAVRDLVAGWELSALIVDSQPHSIVQGRIVAGPDAHCTHYISRAFRLWGLEPDSQYDAFYNGDTETDRRMHLLTEVAKIGTLGPEPLLLEAMEIGFDPPSRYLADVLFGAQRAEWQATGRIVGPSESPMERAPWFTYQGLRVDRDGDARWDVMVSNGGPQHQTAAFRTATRMVATKAAYLWAAVHPHPYSDRLVAYVREHGRLETGFASGIYTATDSPTANYGDVNTNGIILQAIAVLLDR